ncbi:hypothetical protein GLOTRDRAFT_46819, partial [Gloeophyllum trabeum ATCC 11539]
QTKYFPLRTTTVEENTIDGNNKFIEVTYFDQLGFTSEELCEFAIPTINDQATNSRIRSAKALRRGDVNAFTRLEPFQVAPGLFHLQMNLIWALLHVHRGSLNDEGSLSFFFTLLERTRLNGEHPDFYTLHSTLMQILDGLILSAWELECGYGSLAEFAASAPSKEKLREIAVRILKKHGDVPALAKPDDNTIPETDTKRCNVQLLFRDLSLVAVLDNAISEGDWGRIEDMLGTLAAMFRGAGPNKYSTEILYLIHNLQVVWTPDFANIMRDNLIINPTGRAGHAMGVDLNIEHQIGQQKVSGDNIHHHHHHHVSLFIGTLDTEGHPWKLGEARRHISMWNSHPRSKKITGKRFSYPLSRDNTPVNESLACCAKDRR